MSKQTSNRRRHSVVSLNDWVGFRTQKRIASEAKRPGGEFSTLFMGTNIAEGNVLASVSGREAHVMFIHEMTEDECRNALAHANIGHLACARDNQPYIMPINFGFDGRFIYGFTTVGQKVEWMRANPLVCFEVAEIISQNHWTSIIAFGKYEELPDQPEYEEARKQGYECLQKRPMWWEPAYISPEHRDHPHSLTPIFFRIHIDSVTGHRAQPERCECNKPIEDPAIKEPTSRSWFGRIWFRPGV